MVRPVPSASRGVGGKGLAMPPPCQHNGGRLPRKRTLRESEGMARDFEASLTRRRIGGRVMRERGFERDFQYLFFFERKC